MVPFPMQITRLFEFDSGHRIPNHNSKCRNMHGHRYKLELTLSGRILETPNQSHEGMVLDFADVKRLALDFLDTLDHAFLVWQDDHQLIDFLKTTDSKYIIVPTIPTVENLVKFIDENLQPAFAKTYNDSLSIKSIKLWETPNCFAQITHK